MKKNGSYSRPVKLPQYLPKDGFATLTIVDFSLKDGRLNIPFSRSFWKTHKSITISVPPILNGKNVKIIKIVPKSNARYFEIQYVYEAKEFHSELNYKNALGIDLGINNLATCATHTGKTFIIDGRQLKSVNQWYNKENARLQSIKDKQKHKEQTRLQTAITRKRNNRVNDYIAKAARIIINYCLINNIGTIICGYNFDFKRYSNIGKVNNQNFVNIPFGNLRNKLEYLCKFYGIDYHEQEESYTSKASFWDKDEIPKYDANNKVTYKFSGKRIHRGLYQPSKGQKLNADVNGALNILRKSKVVSLQGLYSRGEVNTPARIRVQTKLLERGFLSFQSSRL